MVVLAHDTEQFQRTDDIKISENVVFETMFLEDKTLTGLQKSGFYKPSPIQLHGIPLGKCGFDLLLEAKSGTGKTAVFTIIALEKLDLKQGLQTIILAPTREIAAQICDVIKQIGACYEGLSIEVVMGGLPVQEDIKKFEKNVHIVVGSPGRLMHLIKDKHIDVSFVRLLVLDEADKLMEKSFQNAINNIFSVLPSHKQVIMSSATYPSISKKFISNYVKNAQHVCPENNSVLLGVSQYVAPVKYNSNIVRLTQNRFEELHKILTMKEFKQCLIFCNYQTRVSELFKMLTKAKWPVEQLYGQQEQQTRLDALKTLQEYKCRILISTDLAARGIDASNVNLVIHFEPPYEWQTYLHRIGRAGRFGSYGTAITILSDGKEQIAFKNVLSDINFPITIRNFWTDELFNLDNTDNDTSVLTQEAVNETPISIGIPITNCEDLWNVMICESEEESDEIQNFETLCQSFKTSNESSLCTFSDLLQSFQNNEVDCNEPDTEYNLFKFRDLKINSNLEIENKPHNCESIQLFSSKYTANGNEPSKESQEIILNQVSEKLHDSNSSKPWKITKSNNSSASLHCRNDIESSVQVNYTEGINSTELQKDFQSMEDKKNTLLTRPKLIENKPNFKDKKQRRNKETKICENNISQESHIKPTINGRQPRIKTKQNNNYRKNKSFVDNTKRNRKGENTVLSDTHQNSSSQPYSTLNVSNYDIWYSHLKSHIANIELALYFDEMFAD